MMTEAMRWIDIHCHLPMLQASPEDILHRAQEAGIGKLINIGTEPGDWDLVSDQAQAWFPQIGCTVGVHPHAAVQFNDQIERDLELRLHKPWVVALGEIGLDYFYLHSPREVQQEVFRRQLDIGCGLGLPIQVHTRDAERETLEILQDYRGRLHGGVIHCFTGTWELARGALDLGLDISVSGVVTFKKAEALREVLAKIPLNRLHLETDAPFLAPVPKRGKINEPAFLFYTAEYFAQMRGISLAELAEQVWQNSHSVFSRLAT